MRKFVSVLLFVIGLVSLPLLFVSWVYIIFPVALFFGSWVNSKRGQAWHKEWIKKNPHIAEGLPAGSFMFPKHDSNNKRLLTIYEAIVAGATKKQNGIYPQDSISALRIGEQVLLEADPNNEHDETVAKVLNMKGHYLGWIQMGDDLDSLRIQDDIVQRLTDGCTVLSRVRKKYEMENGGTGIIIDVACYSA